jgi:hypothetical protein
MHAQKAILVELLAPDSVTHLRQSMVAASEPVKKSPVRSTARPARKAKSKARPARKAKPKAKKSKSSRR